MATTRFKLYDLLNVITKDLLQSIITGWSQCMQGDMTMEITIKKLSPAIFVIILICFFLPFVSASCGGQKLVTLSGVQLVTGTTVEGSRPSEDIFGTERERQKVDAEPLAISALITTLVGLGLSFLKNRRSAIAPAIAGAATVILLLTLKYKLDNDVLKEGEGMIQIEYNFGFWLAFLFSILAVVLNLFLFMRRKGEISSEGE